MTIGLERRGDSGVVCTGRILVEAQFMMPKITNIHSSALTEQETPRGTWRYIDLSGERLGVRVEELAPGKTSSVHHFHTAEEEHVIALEGSATLFVGTQTVALHAGDHVAFAAGGEAHHIDNTSSEPFRFLVFGERHPHDVVVYPEHQVMLVKGLGFKQYTYRPVPRESGS